MTNHVHLLVTPSVAGGVSRMMQMLGRRYVGYYNATHHRTGTLWEGRFKASLVGSRRYVLACYRYIEMNPVRAAMVALPEDYPWSSVHANAFGHPNPLLTPHATFHAIAVDASERQSAYRSLLRQSISDEELQDIRAYVQQQRALGSTRFQAAIETALGRCASVRPRGRPSQTTGKSTSSVRSPQNERDK